MKVNQVGANSASQNSPADQLTAKTVIASGRKISAQGTLAVSTFKEAESAQASSKAIGSRKVNTEPLQKQIKSELNCYKQHFRAIRNSVWAELSGTRFSGRAPGWVSEHHGRDDPRYPAAFVRALQHLAPEDLTPSLQGSAESAVIKIEAWLGLSGEPLAGQLSPLAGIPSFQIIDLLEAAVTYRVMLGESERALLLINRGLKYFEGDVAYQLQDAKHDLTRDLHLPKS